MISLTTFSGTREDDKSVASGSSSETPASSDSASGPTSGSVTVFKMPGLSVSARRDDRGKITLFADGLLKPFSVPVLSLMNERLDAEKPAKVTDTQVFPSAWLPPIPSPVFTRLVKDELKAAFGIFSPETVSFEVTRRYNPNCGPGDEPDAADIKKAIDRALDMGAVVITFTEGDPLLSDDIIDLVAHVDKEKAVVMAYTWGLDMTPEKARRLKEAGLQTLLVSLYSTSPDVHDRKRGIPGAFEKAVAAIRCGLDAGLLVTAATHVDKDKVSELNDIYALAKSLGVHEFSVWESVPGIDGILRMDDAGRVRILDFYRTINAESGTTSPRVFSNTFFEGEMFGCMAGRRWMHIGVDGDVRPDPYIPQSYGNAFKEPLRKCWARMRREKIFRRKRKVHPLCDPDYAEKVRNGINDARK